ncbi:NACHT domain-containing protein [Candidatus Dependentiae bacterium]|nr:NACHT domain-containing protein [Candidatus Dependentiae bacterium]
MLRVYYSDSGKHSDKEVQAFSRIWSFLEKNFGDSDIDIRLLLWSWVFRDVHDSIQAEPKPGKKPPSDAVEFDYLILTPNLLAVGEYKNFDGINLDGSENEVWTLFDEKRNKKVRLKHGSKNNINPYHQLINNRRGFSGSILQLCKTFNSWTGKNLMHSINMLLTFKGPIHGRSQHIESLLNKDKSFKILDIASGDLDILKYLINTNELSAFKKPFSSSQLDSIIDLIGFDPKKPKSRSQGFEFKIEKSLERYSEFLKNRFRNSGFEGLTPRLFSGNSFKQFPEIFVEPYFKPEILETEDMDEQDYFLSSRVKLNRILENDNILILGDPGSGKTTLIKHLTLSFLKSKHKDPGNSPDYYFPIYLRASDLAKGIENGNYEELIKYLLFDEYRKFSDILEYFISKERVILMIDGLDEIPDRVLGVRVNKATLDLKLCKPGIKLILTSRIYRNRDIVFESNFKKFFIQELSSGQQSRFLESWLNEIYEPDKQAEMQKKLKNELFKNRNLRRISRNPLILTMIIIMFSQGIKLSDNKIFLFESITDTLVDSWPLYHREKLLPKHEIIFILKQTASFILRSSNDNQISEFNLRSILTDRFNAIDNGIQEPEINQKIDRFLEMLEKDTGYLISRGRDKNGMFIFSFIHKSFYEYMASLQFAESWLKGEIEIRDYIHKSEFRETIFNAADYLSLLGHDKSTLFLENIFNLQSNLDEYLHRDWILVGDFLKSGIKVEQGFLNKYLEEIINLILKTKIHSVSNLAIYLLQHLEIEKIPDKIKKLLVIKKKEGMIKRSYKNIINLILGLDENIDKTALLRGFLDKFMDYISRICLPYLGLSRLGREIEPGDRFLYIHKYRYQTILKIHDDDILKKSGLKPLMLKQFSEIDFQDDDDFPEWDLVIFDYDEISSEGLEPIMERLAEYRFYSEDEGSALPVNSYDGFMNFEMKLFVFQHLARFMETFTKFFLGRVRLVRENIMDMFMEYQNDSTYPLFKEMLFTLMSFSRVKPKGYQDLMAAYLKSPDNKLKISILNFLLGKNVSRFRLNRNDIINHLYDDDKEIRHAAALVLIQNFEITHDIMKRVIDNLFKAGQRGSVKVDSNISYEIMALVPKHGVEEDFQYLMKYVQKYGKLPRSRIEDVEPGILLRNDQVNKDRLQNIFDILIGSKAGAVVESTLQFRFNYPWLKLKPGFIMKLLTGQRDFKKDRLLAVLNKEELERKEVFAWLLGKVQKFPGIDNLTLTIALNKIKDPDLIKRIIEKATVQIKKHPDTRIAYRILITQLSK